jgi:hypothetical protein
MASRSMHDNDRLTLPSLPSLPVNRFNWQAWLSGGLSLAFLITILWKIKDFGFVSALHTLPAKPVFWLAFAGYYLALPSSEWLIFRRLWNLPASGFAALLRKLISNEVLLGYSGEAYFYTWARRHAQLVTAPFGAIKDVSILSALAGNIITLLMLIIAWPFVGSISPHFHLKTVALSAGVMIAMSMVILTFKGKVFSLRGSQLWGIFGVHIARLLVTTVLSGVMWHEALPTVPLVWLVLLATLQLLVTRLPLVPNKDMVFASLAIFLIGNDGEVAALIAMIATAILATHLIIGAALLLRDAVKATNG